MKISRLCFTDKKQLLSRRYYSLLLMFSKIDHYLIGFLKINGKIPHRPGHYRRPGKRFIENDTLAGKCDR